MKETWIHHVCTKCGRAPGPTPQRQEICAWCRGELKVSFVEKVPVGHYMQGRERKLKCETCGLVETHMIQNGQNTGACTREGCAGVMHVLIEGTPYIPTANLAMGDSATPDAIDRWQKQRADKQKIEERKIKEHGSL